MSVAVLGAGAFGTALAMSLAAKGPVVLWARNASQAKEMQAKRENKRYLPGLAFPDTLTAVSDLESLSTFNVCLLAVPMQKLRACLADTAAQLDGKTLVACCKGMELTSGLGPLDIISEACPNSVRALLTGPSFASDIAAGLPTALTLACADGTACKELQHRLSTPTLRLYRTADETGASLGGALKNVIAIACGAAMGAGFGESARAAVMTRGHAEMVRYALSVAAQPETLAGLSGFGDLVLTCTSQQSRNYRFGLALGAGDAFDSNITVEGAATALAVTEQATGAGLDMPISMAVAALVEKRLDVRTALTQLLARSLKEE
ncbi:MAG: NAD(P)H-dependent glycerol-3-phosphate dehydrogenase [Pseudomonadota bacterium]